MQINIKKAPLTTPKFAKTPVVLGNIGGIIFLLIGLGLIILSFFMPSNIPSDKMTGTTCAVIGCSQILAGIIFKFIAPWVWKLGDIFRKFSIPSYYTAKDPIELATTKIYWMIGPQCYALLFTFFILMLVCYYFSGFIYILIIYSYPYLAK